MNRSYLLSLELGQSLSRRQLTVTTAESCTGGGIAQAITDIPGSSQWFSQGFITYSNSAKQQLLGVNPQLFEIEGAVSQAVVEAMATGALKAANAELSIAISGIAGPDGGTVEKPVGTVWICWLEQHAIPVSQCFQFMGDRKEIRNQAVIEALRGIIDLANKNTV
ncbi:MAG: nicotinamide-nucleotide amidase [Kiritimatiellia bacterium]|jgi:nicotinamide-nucleotide amidase